MAMFREVVIGNHLPILNKTDGDITNFLYESVLPVMENNGLIVLNLTEAIPHERFIQACNRWKTERAAFNIAKFRMLINEFSTKYEIIPDDEVTPLMTSGRLTHDLLACLCVPFAWFDIIAALLCAGFKAIVYPLSRDLRFRIRRRYNGIVKMKRLPVPERMISNEADVKSLLKEMNIHLQQDGVYLTANGNSHLPHIPDNLSLDVSRSLNLSYASECSLENFFHIRKFLAANYESAVGYTKGEDIFFDYTASDNRVITRGEMILACISLGFEMVFKENGGRYMECGKVKAKKREGQIAASAVPSVTTPVSENKRKSEESEDESAKKAKK